MAGRRARRRGPPAEPATEDRDSPKSFEWRQQRGSLPQFLYAPGSEGIPERPVRTRASSVPPTDNSGHADEVLAVAMRQKLADGTGAEEQLTNDKLFSAVASISPDGKLAFSSLNPTGENDLGTIELQGERKIRSIGNLNKA